jgi:hypothetical protein
MYFYRRELGLIVELCARSPSWRRRRRRREEALSKLAVARGWDGWMGIDV